MAGANDTIFAPASGAGAAAICVIRISGRCSHDALAELIDGPCPPSARLSRRWIVDGAGERIDDALVVAFPEGRSFTGEAMAEIHCHGSRAVVAAISHRLTEDLGCRLAEPGEFTRRAFEAQKIGLPEAEGLADLIASETELQRRQAMRIMSGAVSGAVEKWRSDILQACALVEVTIDWVDEDVPEDVEPEVSALISRLIVDLEHELSRSRTTQRLKTGLEVAIIGAPNAGKSSLINHLAGRDAAIVSDRPGTTRDVIEVRYDLEGIPVVFLDTAGVRETDDEVEELGVDRAIARAEGADLRVYMRAPDVADDARALDLLRDDDIRIGSKADLDTADGNLTVSVRDGRGIDRLMVEIHERLALKVADVGLIGHMRHEATVRECLKELRVAQHSLGRADAEIVAEDLRRAAACLELLVGRIDTEAVLDVVFGTFCLGK